jgi:hypothetical protein
MDAPRTLRFVLERHGGTVNGSTRAALHHWEIDIDAWTARIVKERHRQLYPQSPRLDVQPLADRVAEAILNQAEHPWITRKPDGSVRVNIGAIIPAGDQRTTVARRKRFRTALARRLNPHGWQEKPYNHWIRE